METGRTFATLMSDIETRQLLLDAETEDDFKVRHFLTSFVASLLGKVGGLKTVKGRNNLERSGKVYNFKFPAF